MDDEFKIGNMHFNSDIYIYIYIYIYAYEWQLNSACLSWCWLYHNLQLLAKDPKVAW